MFTAVKTMIDQQAATRAREEFDNALDEAEKYCPDCCNSCAPDYLIEVSLDKALRAEPVATPLLTAAEYNRLAELGSSVWDFQKSESYVKKALTKSEAPSDLYLSYLVLGHINFKHLNDDSEHAKLNVGRDNFRKAIASIQAATASDLGKVHHGEGYSLWAAHEAVLHNYDNAEQMMEVAWATWSRLPNRDILETAAYDRTQRAASGSMPEVACLFKKVGICSPAPPRAAEVAPWTTSTS